MATPNEDVPVFWKPTQRTRGFKGSSGRDNWRYPRRAALLSWLNLSRRKSGGSSQTDTLAYSLEAGVGFSR